MKIAIVGQGYVGLPLALGAVAAGYCVVGFDNSDSKVNMLKNGRSYVEDISDSELTKALKTGKYLPSSDPTEIRDCEIKIVCVPTPLDSFKKPDLTPLESALTIIGQNMVPTDLIILESTVAPGTTRQFVIPLLSLVSRISQNDLKVAFSPERIDPNNKIWNLSNTAKLISGFNQESLNVASDFYKKLTNNIVHCASLEIAEMAKLLENSFRYINISFINEISRICNQLDINIKDVIEAAETKPYGFMPFYPSLGVGGHCIPVDSLYLSDLAKSIGVPSKFIELAEQINEEMPKFIIEIAKKKLNGLSGRKILVIGLSYKPNIADIRESPSIRLINELKNSGAEVKWHDDLVKEWEGSTSVPLDENYELAIIATEHSNLNLSLLGKVPILSSTGNFK
jgi:UDP-N-acetyl-D-glucosamine dehydrogenase